MKNQHILLIVLLQLISAQTFAQKVPLSASVILGISPPKKGLEYKTGFGVKAGAHIKNIYTGMALFAHTGDQLSINYGSVGGFGIDGGRQRYEWKPKFVMADLGYEFKFQLNPAFSSSFMTYFSMGLASITVKSSGVYGSPDNLIINKFGIGGGFAYSVAITEQVSIGIDYRLYPLGDMHFDFGSFSRNEIEHGFHTAGYYDAFFSVVTYRF